MTRLTERDAQGAYIVGDGICGDGGDPERYRGDDVDRFAAYEDTGLEPYEIERLKRERDAAVEELRNNAWCENCHHYDNMSGCGDFPRCDTCFEMCYCKDCYDGSKWEWRGVQEDA